MSAHRAQWKGHIKLGDITCGVGLYTAASAAERISFHLISRKTRNRLKREFVDSETEETVERADQVKGFELDNGDHIMIDPDEVTAVIPDSDKLLELEAFIPCADVDDIYFDKPYYLVPTDETSEPTFAALRDALNKCNATAIARTVLFRRMRTVLIRAHGRGLIATTLNFDYEVLPSEEAFDGVPKIKIDDEMLDLAKHIISTKRGTFDPAQFDDRYENALATLIKAKAEGRTLPRPKPVKVSKPGDLLQALQESAGLRSGSGKPKAANTNSKTRKRPASSDASGQRAKSTRKKAS